MTRKDVFIQIMMEANGFPAASISDDTSTAWPAISRNAKNIVPLSRHEAEELLALLRPQIPGIKLWLAQVWNKTEADIAEMQGRMN